jgi:histidinol-phosphate aminotransferase
MPLSRRSFLTVAAREDDASPSSAFMAARGREAAVAEGDADAGAAEPAVIRISSNENPLGPGTTAVQAFVRAFQDAGRYPTNARPSMGDLRDTIARKVSVRPENIALGAGSWELLRTAVRLYTSSSRPLVTASPSFENPEQMAEQLGVGVKRIPVDKEGRLDLDKMAQAARWSGLVFFCNPNNPTGTVHSAKAMAEFVARVRRESPETAILIDEAYHDYVTDPGYATSLALALEHPNVFITRTLSKAYGMAGLRVGYAVGQPRTIEAFNRWAITFNQNSLSVAAAVAALGDPAHIEAERARNTEVRQFTTTYFQGLGHKVMASQTNFVFVEINRPAEDFRKACAEQRVLVGRKFPPLEKTYARVSLGTMDEMKRATEVFSRVLAASRGAGA